MATQSDNTLATKGDLRALYQQKILPHLGAGTAVVEAIGTLAAGATTLTLANNAITTDATIDIYTNVYGVTPTDVVVSNGSVTMTFDAQESAVQVKVRISPSRVVGVGGGSNLHTYSTDEQVVGTWIDGKPVYEKTIDFGSDTVISHSSWTLTSLSDSGIDRCIYAEGKSAGGGSYHLNCTTSNGRIALTACKDADANVRYLTFQYTTVNADALPSAYQEIQYLESTGTQYIDTGLVTSSGWRIVCSIMLTEAIATNAAKMIFGSVNANSAPYGRSTFYVRNIDGTIWMHTGAGSVFQSNASISLNTVYKFDVNNITNNAPDGAVNDAPITYTDITSGSGFSSIANRLFASNSADSNPFSGRIYNHFKVYTSKDSSQLVAEFVPCRRKSDDVLGMYDLVRKTFYTNAGTGTFTAGPDVN